jgi:hypothetical protein
MFVRIGGGKSRSPGGSQQASLRRSLPELFTDHAHKAMEASWQSPFRLCNGKTVFFPGALSSRLTAILWVKQQVK